MTTQELHARIVCSGVAIGKTTIEQILEIQNPLKQKRGGLGYGVYAMVNATGDSKKLLANINAYAPDDTATTKLIITDLPTRRFSLVDQKTANVVGEGRFFTPPDWTTKKLQSGRCIGEIFQQHTPKNLVGIIGATRCPLFDTSKQCSFCSMQGDDNNLSRTVNEMIEALEIINPSKYRYHLTLTTTLFNHNEFCQIIIGLQRLKQSFPNLDIAFECQPIPTDYIWRLQKAGVNTLMIPLDCVTPPAQKLYLPGKYDLIEKFYWQHMEFAVTCFGVGNVSSPIVIGLDPIYEGIVAIRDMIDRGVIPEPVPLRIYPNQPLTIRTDPKHLLLASNFVQKYAVESGLHSRMSKIISGCASCGACSGFTLNKLKI